MEAIRHRKKFFALGLGHEIEGQTMRHQFLLTLAAGLTLTAPTPGDEAANKKAGETLQGTWAVVSAERNGKSADDVRGHQLRFAGNKFTIKAKDGKLVYEGTYQVDASKKPMTIDFQHTGATLKGKTWKGIFVVEGDALKTCDNAPNPDKERPADFNAKAGSGYITIVFRRAKP
jgi:uncharacterized protein (TIGR03067 family)